MKAHIKFTVLFRKL